MADQDMKSWVVEFIPDTDQLFKRIHRTLFKDDGTIMTGAFAQTKMSVDWSKYSTPVATQRREGNAIENAVARLVVADVRCVPGQTVEHDPDWEKPNRAHSLVNGKKNAAEAKKKLRDAAKIVLPLPL